MFIAADLAANASLSSLAFSANTAALGSSVYWVRASSPSAALSCAGCAYAPANNDSISTEPLTLAFVEQQPTTVVSAQVRAAGPMQQQQQQQQMPAEWQQQPCCLLVVRR
jgi:hypothetical protein